MRAMILAPAVLFLSTGISGCDNPLAESPASFLAPENFFQTAADAEAAVLSTYHPLVGHAELRIFGWAGRDIGSDMSRHGPLDNNVNMALDGLLAWDSESRNVTRPWSSYYEIIARANLAIDRIPGVDMIPQARRDALVGEAKFMRAFAYYYLVRLWGDVPLVVSSKQTEFQVARDPAEQVYAQIVKDATDAAATLPPTWSSSNAGRATSGAARTLLASAHLTRQEWQKAADAAREVIDSNRYSLFPNYLHAFLPSHENGREHIFSVQANGPESPIGTSFTALYYPREARPRQGGGWGMVQPTQWHYDSYIAGDYRKDVTYRRDWVNLQGRKFNNLYPHVYKYRATDLNNVTRGDVNVPIFRYAEVLLIYAEALNELGRTAEAVQVLNQIRARARNADGTARAQPANYSGPATQAAVREAIFMERNWELAHEDKRWFDLVRRGPDYFVSQIAAHDPQATNLEATDILWPIPQSEINVNPKLTQNPGY